MCSVSQGNDIEIHTYKPPCVRQLNLNLIGYDGEIDVYWLEIRYEGEGDECVSWVTFQWILWDPKLHPYLPVDSEDNEHETPCVRQLDSILIGCDWGGDECWLETQGWKGIDIKSVVVTVVCGFGSVEDVFRVFTRWTMLRTHHHTGPGKSPRDDEERLYRLVLGIGHWVWPQTLSRRRSVTVWWCPVRTGYW